VEDNLNPMFFKCIETTMDYDQPETAPPIVLNLWDKDNDILDSTDDFMGRAVIFMQDAVISRDNSVPPEPKWHKIRMGFS
jgi:hypothetical protein